MAKNLMADVAKMLGVELEEAFELNDHEGHIFRIGRNGLEFWHPCMDGWKAYMGIERILNGELEIGKLPWKPKHRDVYFYPNVTYQKVESAVCIDSEIDYARKALGMCYRTEAEAQEHFAEDYKKLTRKE